MNKNKMTRRTGRLLGLLVLVAMLFTAAGASAAPNQNPSNPPWNPPAQKHVTTPFEFFGYNLGDDYQLTPWLTQVLPYVGFRKGSLDYYYELQRTSDRLRVFCEGTCKSEMGYPMKYAVVTSPANWAKIDKIKAIADKLADPRGLTDAQAMDLAKAGVPVFWISGAIHSSERTANETITLLAYQMTSGQDEWTKSIVENEILVFEAINPDGQEITTKWYYKYLGTAYEGSSPPYYNKYMAHDDNRDFIGLSLIESQNSAKARLEWNPVNHADLHQTRDLLYMGASPDPMNINYSPIAIAEEYGMNYYVITQMIAQGYKGVFTYDYANMWNPSYNHMWDVMHNGSGGWWELTGVRSATPVTITSGGNAGEQYFFNPEPYYPPFVYHLRDAMNMQGDALKNAMTYFARNKVDFLYNFYLKGKTNAAKASCATPIASPPGSAPISPPCAFVIPANGARNNAGLTNLLHVLVVDQAIEVHQATAPFVADGKNFAKGDYVVRLDQPYGLDAKQLLITYTYPINQIMNPYLNSTMVAGAGRDYDDEAWALGLFNDVTVVGLNTPLPANLKLTKVRRVAFEGSLVGGVSRNYVLRNDANFNLSKVLPPLWKDKDMSVSQVDAAFTAGGRSFPAGTFLVGTKGTWWNHFVLKALVEKWGLTAYSISSAEVPPSVPLHQPKLGLYYPNVGDMPEGWLRLLLDRSGFPYTQLPFNLSGVTLSDYDVIIITGLSASSVISGSTSSTFPADLKGGIGFSGVAALKSWVEAGGVLALGEASASFAVSPLVNWPVGVVLAPGPTPNGKGIQVRTVVDPSTKVGYGFDPATSIAYSAGNSAPYFTVTDPAIAKVVAKYPNDGATILQNGFLSGESVLWDKASIVDASMGAGHVVMLGNDVDYRYLASGTYNFYWNAIFEGAR